MHRHLNMSFSGTNFSLGSLPDDLNNGSADSQLEFRSSPSVTSVSITNQVNTRRGHLDDEADFNDEHDYYYVHTNPKQFNTSHDYYKSNEEMLDDDKGIAVCCCR